MIDPAYSDKLNIAQEKLDGDCPSVDKQIISLCEMFYTDFLHSTERDATVARAVIEIDELIKQLRWHYGHALLIKEIYPSIEKFDMKNSPKYEDVPAQIMIGLRQLVKTTAVVFQDYEANWFGGKAAGWIFHMMIDNAMIRLISAFDRIAVLLFLVADIPEKKIYFRSGKMKRLHLKLNLNETQQLFNISSSPEFDRFFISYRDRIVHTKSTFSRMAGYIPSSAHFENSELITNYDSYWDTEFLSRLVSAGYKVLSDVLDLAVSICGSIKKPQG